MTERPTRSGCNVFMRCWRVALNRALDQDEIGDGYVMVRVGVSRKGSESPVGHSDANSRRVLK